MLIKKSSDMHNKKKDMQIKLVQVIARCQIVSYYSTTITFLTTYSLRSAVQLSLLLKLASI